MNALLMTVLLLGWLVILALCWLGWQLLRQNGRLLLRVEELKQRLNELELGDGPEPAALPVGTEAPAFELADLAGERRSITPEGMIASKLALGTDAVLTLATEPHSEAQKSEILNPKSEMDESLRTSTATTEGEGRANRFGNRSLARSKIKRDGLISGTVAPDFRLPRLDGRGDLSLEEFRGRHVLLVFSSPECSPCSALAPHLEKFHRAHAELEMVMISKGDPKENRAKVKQRGLTFPIVLQQQWEISRRYAMFATPIAYLINEAGVIAHKVAVGTDEILGLLSTVSGGSFGANEQRPRGVTHAGCLKE